MLSMAELLRSTQNNAAFNRQAAGGTGRSTTVSTSGSSSPLQGLQTMAQMKEMAKRFGLPDPTAPQQSPQEKMLASQLASQAALQAARLTSGEKMQTERLGSGERMQSERLNSAAANLAAQLAANRGMQTERLTSSEKMQTERLGAQSSNLAAQLANSLTLQRERITGNQDQARLTSNLDEQRKKDAAARALALFRATPGGNRLSTLNVRGAAAELG